MYVRLAKHWLLICFLISVSNLSAFSAINVITHSNDGTLADGLNRVTGGTDFLLPQTQQGGQYLIVNESGQVINIIPGGEALSLGNLPAGHQGKLDSGMQLEVVDIGQNRYYLWKGGVTDGGDYYVVVNRVPEISITPSVANFGSVPMGSFQDLILSVSNIGTDDLVLGDVALLDPLQVPFELVVGQDNCSGETLSPSASCTFAVRFSPAATGGFNDVFDVPSNDPVTTSAVINVAGTGATVTLNFSQTDFSENGLGSGVPSGWTERWDTGKASYTVANSTMFPGEKELVVNSNTGARRLITLDAADTLGADTDLLMLFKDPVNEGSLHTDIRLFSRASGAAGNESAYFFTTNNHQGQVNIYKYVNGSLTPLTGGDQKIPFNSTDPWWVRFHTEGSSLKVKIWPYGSVEPTDWQLTAVDTDIISAGWHGLGNYWIGNHIFYEFSAVALPDSASPVNGFGIREVSPIAVNLNAETGNTTGWINEFGSLEVNSSTQKSGSYCFQGGAQNFRAYQRISLAQSGITAQDLAAGAKVAFRAWQRALTWNNDPGRIGIRFLDASQTEISSVFTDSDFKNSTYVPKGLIRDIPTNAAYVDILLEGDLKSGGAVSTYFDDLEVSIGVLQ